MTTPIVTPSRHTDNPISDDVMPVAGSVPQQLKVYAESIDTPDVQIPIVALVNRIIEYFSIASSDDPHACIGSCQPRVLGCDESRYCPDCAAEGKRGEHWGWCEQDPPNMDEVAQMANQYALQPWAMSIFVGKVAREAITGHDKNVARAVNQVLRIMEQSVMVDDTFWHDYTNMGVIISPDGAPEWSDEKRDQFNADTRFILKWCPYDRYLESNHWWSNREAALKRAGNRCQVCNSAGLLDVHHRTYERRGAELPEDLIVLCRKCHEIFHNNGRLAR